MKILLKLEELAMLLLSLLLLWNSHAPWFWYLLLLIGPDIGIVGYWLGNKIGAAMYNLFHHKAIAILFFMVGIYLNIEWVQLIGIVLFGNSSMDRAFGYGLKYNKGFRFTHLGAINRNRNNLQ